MLETLISHIRKARKTGLFAVLGQSGSEGAASLGVLRVSGADAASFLHSQLTNEVKALKPGEGNLSARVTRLGTLVRWFSLHRAPAPSPLAGEGWGEGSDASQHPEFVVLIECDGIPSLVADLEKFAISDDVQFADVSEQFTLAALQGPDAAVLGESVFGKLGAESWLDLPENAIRSLTGADVPAGAYVVARSLTGDTGFIILLPWNNETAPKKLEDMARAKNFVILDGAALNEALEVLRIEAGVVRVGPDALEGKLVLPETSLEQQVVSYSKGCYLGQEIIARIRTYGSVPNVIRGLILDPSPPTPLPQGEKGAEEWAAVLENLPDIGADLLVEDGRKVGQIVSRSISPVLEAPVAFAYLDRASRTPGTKLKLKGKDGTVLTARVVLLPFYKASDLKSRVSFLHDRAIRFFSEEQDEKAITLLEEALRLDPSFADGYEALGVILGRGGRFHDAIDIFKRLEEVAPNEPMVHTNLSLYYMKLGDKQAAEDEKAKATVKQFSRFGSMRKDEQRAAEEAGHAKAEALRKKQMFEEVLEIDGEDPIALFGLGNALSALSDWEGAERVLAKACAVQKDNSACYLAHGKALEMLNRERDALAVYREGMAVASRKGDLMPLKEMERRALLLGGR